MQGCFKRAAAKRFPEEALARAFSFRICRASCLLLAEKRKGGRAAECGGLENRFAHNMGNEGSNPSPSARRIESSHSGAFSFPDTSGTDWGRSPFCLLAHQGLRHRLWHHRVSDKIAPDTFLSGIVLCLAPKCPGRIGVRAEWGRMNFV